MKKFHLDRLTKLGKHLLKKKLGHVKFNFNRYHDNGNAPEGFCGTAGCALGECPVVFPRSWKFEDGEPVTRGENYPNSSACGFFGINYEDAYHLFMPGSQEKKLLHPSRKGMELVGGSTAKEVSQNILHFVKLKKARSRS